MMLDNTPSVRLQTICQKLQYLFLIFQKHNEKEFLMTYNLCQSTFFYLFLSAGLLHRLVLTINNIVCAFNLDVLAPAIYKID